MTIAIVLKPDFTSTFSRGVLRIGGTLAGLAFATGLFHFIHSGTVTDIVLMAVFYVPAAVDRPGQLRHLRYGAQCSGGAAGRIDGYRAQRRDRRPSDQIRSAGGVLAMIAYGVWPTWEKTQTGIALADMLEAYRRYFREVVAAFSQAGDSQALDRIRMESRRARSNAEASVDRLGGEPGVTATTMHHLHAIMVSSHSFVHAVMALESALYRTEMVPARS